MKSKPGGESSHDQYVHQKNIIATLFQIFGATKHFVSRNLEGESKSNCYTDIQSESVGNINKMKLLESGVLDNDVIATFIVPDLVDEYYLKVEDIWFDPTETGVNLFKH